MLKKKYQFFKCLYVFFSLGIITFSPLMMNKMLKHDNQEFYNNAIKNPKIVNLLNYAINNNIDCANSPNIKTCSNIKIELKKENLHSFVSDDLITLFTMYYNQNNK